MSGRHSVFDVPTQSPRDLGAFRGWQEVTTFSRKATTVAQSTVARQEIQTVAVLVSAPSSQ